MRTDLYGMVHKAQRYHLFTFAQDLSRADLTNDGVRTDLARRVHGIVEMLRDHAANEERYIHPLFERLGAGADAIDTEHHALEARLAELVAIVDGGRWDELYRVTMRFIGEYLLHIDAEERAQAEVLWPNYSDAELTAVFVRFKAERDPAADRADLALFLPALSVPELTGLLGRIRGSAPERQRSDVFDLARSVLGRERWTEVERALGA